MIRSDPINALCIKLIGSLVEGLIVRETLDCLCRKHHNKFRLIAAVLSAIRHAIQNVSEVAIDKSFPGIFCTAAAAIPFEIALVLRESKTSKHVQFSSKRAHDVVSFF